MLAVGAVDVVGVLPCPANKLNQGAADFLEAQLFAYGVGSSVAVVEVHELQPACMLQGGHRTFPVTAVKWSPDCHSRDLKSHSSHLRLASGDAGGGVVVWSVLSGTVVSRLEDHFAVREYVKTAVRGREGTTGGGAGPAGGGAGGGAAGAATGGGTADGGLGFGAVVGLAWVMSSSAVLAVLLSPGTLLLWDTKGGAVLWKRTLPGPDLWHGLEVDPLDCRCLALSSGQGGLALVSLEEPGAGRVEVKQYRVGPGGVAAAGAPPSSSNAVAPPAAFQPQFCATRGLLFLLLPRELIVYDTELGIPATSRSLPSGCAPFSSLLGVYGSGVSAGTGDEGGCDVVYTAHMDGGLSVFVRAQGELRYQLAYSGLLMPPPLRGSRHSVPLLAVCAGLWRGGGGGGSAGGWDEARVAPQRVQAATAHLRTAFAAASSLGGGSTATAAAAANTSPHAHSSPPHPHTHHHHHHGPQHHGLSRQEHHPSPGGSQGPGHGHGQPHGAGGGCGRDAAGGMGGLGGGGGLVGGGGRVVRHNDGDLGRPMLLIVALTGDGRVWRFDAPLPALAGPHLLPPLQLPAPTPAAAPAPSTGSPAGPHSRSASSPLAPPPQLAGLLHTLPSAVTTFAIYPRPVHASSLRLTPAAAGGAYDRVDGVGGGVVLLGAAATLGGSVELFAVQRGLVSPLSLQVSASFAPYRDAPVRGVRWLGSTARLVTFFSDRGSHGWSNHLFITDVRSGRSEALPRDAPGGAVTAASGGGAGVGGAAAAAGGGGGSGGGEAAPILGVRASPCGSYLLVLVKGSSAELWGVWPGAPPARLRLLDLPFSCVEWVQPALQYAEPYASHAVQPPLAPTASTAAMSTAAPEAAAGDGAGDGGSFAAATSWRLPLRAESKAGGGDRVAVLSGSAGAVVAAAAEPTAVSFSLSRDASAGTAAPGAAGAGAGAAPSALEEGQLVFTLADGRAGVLAVRGKQVSDMRVKRPMAGLLAPLELTATAIAAVGRLAVMGDAEGRLAVWDWSTGRTTLHATGLGLVRKIQLSPPSPPFPVAGHPSGPGPVTGRTSLSGTVTGGGLPPGMASPSPSTPGLSPPLNLMDAPMTLPSASTATPATSSAPAAAGAATAGAASVFNAAAAAAAAAAEGGGGGGGTAAAGASPPLLPQTTGSLQMGAAGGGGGGNGPNLSPSAIRARAAVLFASGQCVVFDLDGTLRLRPLLATAAAGLRPVLDIGLLPTWWLATAAGAAATSGAAATHGQQQHHGQQRQQGVQQGAPAVAGGPPAPCLLAITTDEGSLSVLDVGAAAAAAAARQAAAAAASPPPAGAAEATTALRRPLATVAGISGSSSYSASSSRALQLAQARSLASSLLLPRPWAMLLRLLLQLGVSQELLRYLCGAYCPGEAEEEDVRLELLAKFPRAARGPLLALLADVPPPAGLMDGDDEAASASGAGGGRAATAGPLAVAVPPAPAPPSSTAAAAGGGSGAVSVASGTSAAAVGGGLLGGISGGIGSAALALSGNMLRAMSTTLTTLTGVAADSTTAPAAAGSSPAPGNPAVPPSPGLVASPTKSGQGQGYGPPPHQHLPGAGWLAGGGCNLLHLLRLLASMRAQGRLLHPDEWLRYSQALQPGASPACRMAVAAQVAGASEEARFWSHLPATLAVVRARELARASTCNRGSRSAEAAPPAAPPGSGPPATSATASSAAAARGGTPFAAAAAVTDPQAARSPAPGPAGLSPSVPSVQPVTPAAAAASTSVLSPRPSASAANTPPSLSSASAGQPSSVGGPAAVTPPAAVPAAATGVSSLMMLIKSSSSGALLAAAAPAAVPSAAPAAAAPPVTPVATTTAALPPPTAADDGDGVLLWDERLVLAEAQERVKWREAQSGAVFDLSPEQQERRLLEYMALGDLQTAVAFLLASSPENSARYYRDALCTLALAAASSAAGAKQTPPGAPAALAAPSAAVPSAAPPRGSVLLAQSAKVISAHAASIGDLLLGVPLHLAAGMHTEAAAMLQESGLWRQAAVMAAHSLPPCSADRHQTLTRWAHHVWRAEGSPWRAAGILTAAGCLGEALQLLHDAGLPDCAAAFAECCQHQGLAAPAGAPPPPPAAAAASAAVKPMRAYSSGDGDEWIVPRRAADAGSVAAAAAPPLPKLLGYDSVSSGGGRGLGGAAGLDAVDEGLLVAGGSGSREGMDGDEGGAGGGGGGLRGVDGAALLRSAEAEFERFVTDLLTRLMGT